MEKRIHTAKDLGWAQITHPFHPLHGQRFRILKIKKSPQKDDILLLESPNKTWRYIPREWTDKAGFVTPTASNFLKLLEIVDEIKAKNENDKPAT